MTTPGLTIPITLEEVEAYVEYIDIDPDFRDMLPVRIAKQCLATMQREAILRKALEDIKAHQQFIGGGLAEFGATWHIANNALENTSEYSGVENNSK